MLRFQTLSIVCVFGLFGSFVSAAHADTVGCHKYDWNKSYTAAHWEKVVKDLKAWKAAHKPHHPYYYTMSKKLVSAEHNWKITKEYDKNGKKKAHKSKHDCKHDVSPS